MFTPSSLKAVAAGGILLAGGTIIALTVQAGDSPRGAGTASPNSLTIPTLAAENSVLAQFSPSSTPTESDDEENQGGQSLQGGFGDGGMAMGGFGGGGMEMGGMSSGMAMSPGATAEWVRPETEDGDGPAWLSGGRSALEAVEKNRQVLSMKLDFEFHAWPLQQVASWLTEETGTQFELAAEEIELGGLASVDSPITASGTDTSVREIIRRTMSALELTYIVTESTIEITTKESANESPTVRFYDLSYVLPNSANAASLIRAITNTVDPIDFQTGDSIISLVGSTMIVSAPDTTHQKVEVLLLNVAKMNPHNVEKPSVASPIGVSSGSVMGGMGGGFGGGGMGGGMGGMF